jgi:endothelin-converting enzyme/putative endopeptidase
MIKKYLSKIRINNYLGCLQRTKVSAVEKLHKSQIKIGYPDKWKDYSALVIKSPEEGYLF